MQLIKGDDEDEDQSLETSPFDHPFTRALQQRHPATYRSLFAHDWILCLPCMRSMQSIYVESVPDAVVLSHVLRPLSSTSKGTTGGMQTVSGKSVSIGADRSLSTGDGFREARSCRILFDELVYDGDGGGADGSFVLFVLDKPLLGPFAFAALSPAGSVDGGEEVSTWSLDRIKTWMQTRVAEDVYSPLFQALEQLILRHSDSFGARADVSSSLSTSAALVQVESECRELVARALRVLASVERYFYQAGVSRSFPLDRLVETWCLAVTYDLTFFRICTLLRDEDERVAVAAANVAHLDLIQLGVPHALGGQLQVATSIFAGISALHVPGQKIECLLRAFHKLSEPVVADASLVISTDLLIPLLLLMVSRARVANLSSCLHYMKSFAFHVDVVTGEVGYVLSTLEAVMSYLCQVKSDLIEASRRNEQLWKSIEDGDIPAVQELAMLSPIHSPTGAVETSRQTVPSTPLSPIFSSSFACRDTKGRDCLTMAAAFGRLELLKYLCRLDISSPATTRDYSGNTALHWAASGNHVHIIEYLLRETSGSDLINAQNTRGETPLHLAVRESKIGSATALLNGGSVSDIVDINGSSALLEMFISSNSGGLWTTGLLMQACDKSQSCRGKDENDNSILHLMTNVAICEKVLSRCPVALLLKVNARHRNPLLEACRAFRSDVATCLLKFLDEHFLYHAITMSDVMGRNVIHFAVLGNNRSFLLEIFRLEKVPWKQHLLNERSIRGDTPLHYAARNDLPEILKLLLEQDANITLRNSQGYTAADTANGLCQDLLDEHTLFHTQYKFPRQRVAVVARAVADSKNSISYLVKSGSPAEPSSSQIVQRTLQDFFWLRKQIMNEMPEVIVSVFSGDLQSSPFSGFRPLVAMQSKHVKALNSFLNELLDHPLLGASRTVIAFLDNQKLDKLEISKAEIEASRRALESSLAGINLQKSMKLNDVFFDDCKVMLDRSDIVFNNMLKCFKEVLKKKEEYVCSLQQFESQFAVSKSVLPPLALTVFSGCLKRITNTLWREKQFRHSDTFAAVVSMVALLSVAELDSLKLLDRRMLEYRNANKNKDKISNDIESLERKIARTDSPNDSTVMKLSELYYEAQLAAVSAESQSRNIAYSIKTIQRELEHAEHRKAVKIGAFVANYANDQYHIELMIKNAAVEALEDLENSQIKPSIAEIESPV